MKLKKTKRDTVLLQSHTPFRAPSPEEKACGQCEGYILSLHVYGTVERELRGARLTTIWTVTTEIQNMIIQHEYLKEILSKGIEGRNIVARRPSQ